MAGGSKPTLPNGKVEAMASKASAVTIMLITVANIGRDDRLCESSRRMRPNLPRTCP
jgi:hypothetical protein